MPAPISPFFIAVKGPPLKAKMAPVANPDTIGLNASSFFLSAISPQSTDENTPPHNAKLPVLNN